jgi:hypothetical protein
VDDLAKAAKKATGKLPEKKSRKKTATRAKKPTSVGANSRKRTARKVVSSAKAPKRPKKAK